MKGLLVKDSLYLRRQMGRILPVLVILFAVMIFLSLSSPGKKAKSEDLFGLFSFFIVVTALAFSINIPGMDEQAKWDNYARSLPLSVAVIVGSQYLLPVILAGIGTVLEFTAGLAMGTALRDLAIVCGATFGAPLVLCSLTFPLLYKFGVQKASVFIMLIGFLVPVSIGLIQKNGGAVIPDPQLGLLLRLLPVIAAVIVLGSYFLSCHIYAKKDV